MFIQKSKPILPRLAEVTLRGVLAETSDPSLMEKLECVIETIQFWKQREDEIAVSESGGSRTGCLLYKCKLRGCIVRVPSPNPQAVYDEAFEKPGHNGSVISHQCGPKIIADAVLVGWQLGTTDE